MTDYKRRLLESLVKILSQLRDQVDAVRKNQETHNNATEQNWNRPIRAKTQLPKEVAKYYQSENSDRPAKTLREWTLLIVQVTGVAVALAYAVFTYRTLREIQKQTPAVIRSAKAARKSADAAKLAAESAERGAVTAADSLTKSIGQFRTDERAWIEIDRIEVEKQVVDKPIPNFPAVSFIYRFTFKNVGKTLARAIVLRRGQVTGDSAYGSNASALSMAQDRLLKPRPTDAAPIPPYPMPTEMAPNATTVAPVNLGGQAPRENIYYDYMIGRIDYIDAFGVPHWVKFCLVILGKNGSFQYCDKGNSEDENPETVK